MEPRSNSIWTCNATEISVALHCEHATHERFPALVGLARPNDCLGCRLHSLYVTEHGSGKQRKGGSRRAWGPRREASCRWDANDGAGPGTNQYLRRFQRQPPGRSLKISGRCGGFTYRVWFELFWTAVLWSMESANVDATPDRAASPPGR